MKHAVLHLICVSFTHELHQVYSKNIHSCLEIIRCLELFPPVWWTWRALGWAQKVKWISQSCFERSKGVWVGGEFWTRCPNRFWNQTNKRWKNWKCFEWWDGWHPILQWQLLVFHFFDTNLKDGVGDDWAGQFRL